MSFTSTILLVSLLVTTVLTQVQSSKTIYPQMPAPPPPQAAAMPPPQTAATAYNSNAFNNEHKRDYPSTSNRPL